MFLVAKESETYVLFLHTKKENSGLVRLQFKKKKVFYVYTTAFKSLNDVI